MVRANRGITLIEVLVSLVILSFALLGTAAMITTSMKKTNESNHHTQIMFLLNDMADRMRANPAGVSSGAYNSLTTVPTNPNCMTVGCNSTQMANTDMVEWNSKLAKELPTGHGTVVGVGHLFTITIYWDEDGFNNVSQSKSFNLSVLL